MDVTREIELDAPPDEVWEALTDEDKLAEWFANDVELDAQPGGEGVFRWDDGEERHALVEEVDPERRFVFTWDDSRVVIELEPIPAGTRVTVVEAPVAEWATALELRACLSRSGRGKAATYALVRLRRAYAAAYAVA